MVVIVVSLLSTITRVGSSTWRRDSSGDRSYEVGDK